jgi:hypothetical protein
MNLRIVFAVVAALICGVFATQSNADETTSRPAEFKVFDNLFYPKKPDLSSDGFLQCNIVYAGHVWKGAEKSPDYGKIPDEDAFKQVVKARTKGPGPVVLDFETLRLSGKPDVVEPHFKLFITLAKWAHEAAPGHVVGYYGHGLFPELPGKEYGKETEALTAAVDAFFPSLYTFNEDRDAWKKKAEGLIQLAHKIAPGKPVYLYVWPQFHGVPHGFLTGDQWAFELAASRELGANGLVMWSSSMAPAWDVSWPWWNETLKFMQQK